MASYSDFYEKFKSEMNIFIIYIMEAHFVENSHNGLEGWPIGYQYRIPQHRQLSDRIDRALQLKKEFRANIPIYLDTMSNDFNLEYGAWPDMLYYVENDIIQFQGKLNHGVRTRTFAEDLEMTLANKNKRLASR